MKISIDIILRGVQWILSPIVDTFLKLSVARGIVISFGSAIFIGSFIIYFLESGNLPFIDSLYLSASAICVTGLSTVQLTTLSTPTLVAILIFMQAGGLGIIVVTVLVGLLLLNNLSRNTKLHEFITEAIDVDSKNIEFKNKDTLDRSKILRVLLSLFNITLTLELIGFILLYNTLPEVPGVERFFLAIFTTISAFNNAGFSLTNDISFLAHEPVPLLIICGLVIVGGIGYPVIIFIEKTILETIKRVFEKLEIYGETYVMRMAIQGKEPSSTYILFTKISYYIENRISDYNQTITGESNRVQTKIILYGTLSLLLMGWIGIFILEGSNPETMGSFSFEDKLMNSFLLSVSSRTSGFSTLSLSEIKDPSLVLICLLMFVGGGPQGTAGGIKITTFVILAKYLINVIHSQGPVKIMGQAVSKRSVAMATRLYFLATTSLAILILIISYLHNTDRSLDRITFEAISSFSTVGLSLGITENLSTLEKLIYILLMYTGRIGIFTVLISITGNPVTTTGTDEDEGLKIQVG